MDEATRSLLWLSLPKVLLRKDGKLFHTYRGQPPKLGEAVELWRTGTVATRWIVTGVRWSFCLDGNEWPEAHVQLVPLDEAIEWAEQNGATLSDFGWR